MARPLFVQSLLQTVGAGNAITPATVPASLGQPDHIPVIQEPESLLRDMIFVRYDLKMYLSCTHCGRSPSGSPGDNEMARCFTTRRHVVFALDNFPCTETN